MPEGLDIDELQKKLDDLQAAARMRDEQQPDINAMREQLSGVQASVTSADKAVTVTAGPGGSISDIRFTQDATRLSPIQLSSTVMNTLRQAVAEAARQQATIVQEHVPDSDVLERVRKTQEQVFGATSSQGAPPAPAPAPPTPSAPSTAPKRKPRSEREYDDTDYDVPQTFLH